MLSEYWWKVLVKSSQSHIEEMEITNVSEEAAQNDTPHQLFCSTGLTGEIHHQLTCLLVLNIFLSISAFLGNTLILAALQKESSLHPPSKLLLRSLATTDLCVGLISEPLHVTYWMSVVNEHWNICRYSLALGFIASYLLLAVSLLTLAAISVDRLLALLLGLRYRQVVTLKRTYAIVITFWVVSSVTATMYLWNFRITIWWSHIVISLCLATSMFSYTKIFLTLRHHQTHAQDHLHQEQPSQTSPLNIARYKKAVTSALWLQVTLACCYLPHGIMEALWSNYRLSSSVFLARQCTFTLVYLNSSLNPILYCWKIREVRQAVKGTIRQVLCCSSN